MSGGTPRYSQKENFVRDGLDYANATREFDNRLGTEMIEGARRLNENASQYVSLQAVASRCWNTDVPLATSR
jgi:hypothetical protein